MNKLEQYDESRLITNPFSYTLQLPVTEVISNISYTRDPEDGLITNSTFYQERISSTRIYLCEECKDAVYNCSTKAQRLYLFILYNIKTGKDHIQINKELYMKKNNISSSTTYNDAIKELVRYGFISSTEYKTVFWINPNMFFNGNRLKKYNNKVVVKSTWEQ